MFWRYYGGNSSILSPERRCEVVFQALECLVYEAHPDENLKITSRPAKDTIERLLVEVVDAATRFADTFPVPSNSWESRHLAAAQGIPAPPPREDSGANAEEQRSFIDRAHASTRLGRKLSLNVFAALFVAIVDAREIFLADERMAQQDPSRHSPLAQAVDRFKAAAWWWYKAKSLLQQDPSRHSPLAQAVDRFKAAAWWWYKAKSLPQQDPSRHSPLAQAVDRFKAAAWWWYKAKILLMARLLNLPQTAKTMAMRMRSEVVDNGSIRENPPALYDFPHVPCEFPDFP